MRTYTAVIQRDFDTGDYVGHVPGFPGAHSQGKTIEELRDHLAEVIAMLLEDGEPDTHSEFVGTQNRQGGLTVPRPPVLKPREVVRLLTRLGFVEVRQRGSHRQFRHPDGRATTLPDHAGRDLAPELLKMIAQQIGLTWQELVGVDL